MNPHLEASPVLPTAASASLFGLRLSAGVTRPAGDFADDLDVLQFVLGLEHMSYALFREALRRFGSPTSSEHRPQTDSPVQFTELRKRVGWRDGEQRPRLRYPTLQRICDHERFHVKLIASRVAARGARPAARATYDFGYADFDGFLAVAAHLEDAVVQSYAAALRALSDPGLRALFAGLLTVESQHAAHLHLRLGDGPFSFSADIGSTRAELDSIARRFVVG